MKKFRIVKVTEVSGEVDYRIQQRLFFFWWFDDNLYNPYGLSTLDSFKTLEAAQDSMKYFTDKPKIESV